MSSREQRVRYPKQRGLGTLSTSTVFILIFLTLTVTSIALSVPSSHSNLNLHTTNSTGSYPNSEDVLFDTFLIANSHEKEGMNLTLFMFTNMPDTQMPEMTTLCYVRIFSRIFLRPQCYLKYYTAHLEVPSFHLVHKCILYGYWDIPQFKGLRTNDGTGHFEVQSF